MLEKLFLLKVLNKLPNWVGHVYSLVCIVIGWTIFAQTDFSMLGEYLQSMFGIGSVFVDEAFWYFLSCNGVLLILLCLCSIDYSAWTSKWTFWQKVKSSRFGAVGKCVVMAALLFVSFAFLVGDTYNPFLYFRF